MLLFDELYKRLEYFICFNRAVKTWLWRDLVGLKIEDLSDVAGRNVPRLGDKLSRGCQNISDRNFEARLLEITNNNGARIEEKEERSCGGSIAQD
jgi:hypothetical protein